MKIEILFIFLSLMLGVLAQSLEVECGNNLVLKNVTSRPQLGTIGNTSYTDYKVYNAPSNYEGYDSIDINGKKTDILIYKPCPSMKKFIEDDVIQGVPQPIVRLIGDSFNIEMEYMRDEITYAVSFCELDSFTCATERPQIYNSAPVATFPGTFLNFHGYKLGNPNWRVNALNCSRFSITSTIAARNMLDCGPIGRSKCIDTKYYEKTPYVDFKGTLYIGAFRRGILVQKWAYPFIQRYSSIVNVIGSMTQGGSEVTFSTLTYMDSNNYLYVRIATTASSVGQYLSDPVYADIFSLTWKPDDKFVQIWEYKTIYNQSNYQNTYKFEWTSNPGRNPISITIQISLSNQVLISQEYTRNINMVFFNDKKYSIPYTGSYSPSSTIYVASIYTGTDNVKIGINNMWICRSIDPMISPSYDPKNGKYGCKNPTPVIPASNIVQLISSGSAIKSKNFNIDIRSGITVGDLQALGLELTYPGMSQGMNFIHLELVISTVGKTSRIIHQIGNDTAVNLGTLFMLEQSLLEKLADPSSIQYYIYALISVLTVTAGCLATVIGVTYKICANMKLKKKYDSVFEDRISYLKLAGSSDMPGPVPNSVEDVIDSIFWLQHYQKYAWKQNKLSDIMFLLNVKRLELTTDDRSTFTNLVVKDFISAKGSFKVSLPDDLRSHYDNVNESYKYVVKEMDVSILPKFRKYVEDSRWYTDYINTEQSV